MTKRFQIHWWDAPPYIFLDKGKISGIIPSTFGTNGSINLCGSNCAVSYSPDFQSYQTLFNITKNHKHHLSEFVHLYGPIYTNLGHGHLKGFHQLPMTNSTHQTILIRSFYDSLLYRGMIVGTESSFIFFFVIALLLSMFAFLAWLVEHREKDGLFDRHFSRGVWNGFYWATVTMTSVGYGDITTKTAVGKVLAVIWMLFSVLLLSALTAMLTSGLGNAISLENHRVAYLNGISVSKKIEKERGIAVGYESYKELFGSTESGVTFASVADLNVISYTQDKLWDHDLIVDKNVDLMLSVQIKVPIIDHKNDTNFYSCLEATLKRNAAKFLRRLKPNKGFSTLAALQSLSRKDTPIFIVILVLFIVLVCCGVGIDLWEKFKDTKSPEKAEEIDADDSSINVSVNPNVSFGSSTRHYIQLAQICRNVTKLKTDLKQQASLLSLLKSELGKDD